MIEKNYFEIKEKMRIRDKKIKELDEEKRRINESFNEDWSKFFKAFEKYDVSIVLYDNVRIQNGLLITSWVKEDILEIIKDLEPIRCEIEHLNYSWSLHIDMDAGFKGESYE